MVNFSIPKFIGIFLFLWFGFLFYVGITTVGGSVYSPFLVKHLNLVDWFAAGISKSASVVLEILGYKTHFSYPNRLSIESSRGVLIAFACFGVGVISFWVAFVVAHKASIVYKIKWVFIGFVSIFFLNIIRIALIVVAQYLHWKTITSLDHHTVFNIASYIIIGILILCFIRSFNRWEKVHKLINAQQAKGKLSETF